ncbi:SDR family oxidoreductase [Saccharopolyspora shandongensis]|uniref:SDR family oxidoreductase n=1 Tax=Saccharopolyspora shandongensis TaxID=418495 RepID=UPI00342D44D1
MPGATALTRAKQRSERESRILTGKSLLGRLGQPYKVAATTASLLSPGAGYITGTTLAVDRGSLSRDSTGLDDTIAEAAY